MLEYCLVLIKLIFIDFLVQIVYWRRTISRYLFV